MNKAICTAVIILAMLFFSACGSPAVVNADRVELIYNEMKYEPFALTPKSRITLEGREKGDMQKALSQMRWSEGSECGYGNIEIIITEGDRAYHYFPAVDGDETICMDLAKGKYYAVDQADLEVIHQIIMKHIPDEAFDWMKMYAEQDHF